MPTPVRFFSPEEFKAQEDARRAAVQQWQSAHPDIDTGKAWPPELLALNDSFFPAGSAWYAPWYHDPKDPEDVAQIEGYIAAAKSNPSEKHFLSIHYLTDWARSRPPIMLVCPGGGHWCPDQQSTNGSGWVVTGELPNITCSPSIWVSQGAGAPREYHGFLREGVFTDAL